MRERVRREVRDRDKLQALVYDILPLEEGARKRCSECEIESVHRREGRG